MKNTDLSGTVVPMTVAPGAVFAFSSDNDRQRYQEVRAQEIKKSEEIVRDILNGVYEQRTPLPKQPNEPEKGGDEQSNANDLKVCTFEFEN